MVNGQTFLPRKDGAPRGPLMLYITPHIPLNIVVSGHIELHNFQTSLEKHLQSLHIHTLHCTSQSQLYTMHFLHLPVLKFNNIKFLYKYVKIVIMSPFVTKKRKKNGMYIFLSIFQIVTCYNVVKIIHKPTNSQHIITLRIQKTDFTRLIAKFLFFVWPCPHVDPSYYNSITFKCLFEKLPSIPYQSTHGFVRHCLGYPRGASGVRLCGSICINVCYWWSGIQYYHYFVSYHCQPEISILTLNQV